MWGPQGQDDLSKYTKCVVGIDRDGTINRDLGTYVTRPGDFIPIEGSLEALAINVYKVTGTSIDANVILRWGEAQA